MSCLINEAQQGALRDMIANDLYTRANANTPIILEDYVREIYDFVKTNSSNEAMAVDAARLVPTMLQQITSLKPAMVELLEKVSPDIEFDILKLKKAFAKDVEAVRDMLGLKESPAAVFDAVKEDIEIAEAQEKIALNKKAIKYNPIPYGAFRSFGVEVKNHKDVNSVDYMVPKPEYVHAFTVMRALDHAMEKQIVDNSISDSSQLNYPGVDGGVFLKIIGAPNNGMSMTVINNKGQAIKFDAEGNVSPDGKAVSYVVTSAPLRNSAGEVITEEEEFKEYKSKMPKNELQSVVQGVFDNIQQSIKAQIKFFNPEGKVLSAEETKVLRDRVVASVKEQYALQQAMRNYLNSNPGSYIGAAINGSSKGFIVQNIWKETDLSAIDFSLSKFKPEVETSAQTAGSIYTPGVVYFKYAGVDKPIAAVGRSFQEKPEILKKIIQLFTGDLYSNTTGKLIKLSIPERNELLQQYLYTSDITFKSNKAGGDALNWLNSDGTVTLKIGDKELKIKFDGTPEAATMQKAAADAIEVQLKTPYIKATKEGYGDENLNSWLKIDKVEALGANVVIAKAGESFEDAVAAGPERKNADGNKAPVIPGSIFVVTKPSRTDRGDIDNGFRVYYPTVNANNNNLNKRYDDVSFTEEDGKQVIKTESKLYNDYILDNFATSATTVNGKIRTVGGFIAFAPLPNQYSKFLGENKENKPTTIDEAYVGKIIYGSPGSGKSKLASTTDNVIDTDDLIVAEIKKQHPEFTINANAPVNTIPYTFVVWGSKLGITKDSVYDAVAAQMKELAASGKTVLTGSRDLMKYADYVFLQHNQTILNNKQFDPTKERAEAKRLGKGVEIKTYMDDVLSTAPISAYKVLETLLPTGGTLQYTVRVQNNKTGKKGGYTIDNTGRWVVSEFNEKTGSYDIIGKPLSQEQIINSAKTALGEDFVNKLNSIKAETDKITDVKGGEKWEKFLELLTKYNAELGEVIQPRIDQRSEASQELRIKQSDIAQARKEAKNNIYSNMNSAGTQEVFFIKPLLDSGVQTLGELSKKELLDKIDNGDFDKELSALKTPAEKNAPLEKNTISSLSPEDIMNALMNKKFNKGSKAKATETRATAEQNRAAEAWYAQTRLSTPFPFRIVNAAVNASFGGPAAQWAVHGVILYHYFNEDGKFDASKSGDYTDLYHEAWHGFTQTFLTPEQRKEMYNELSKRAGSFMDFKGRYVTFKDAEWEQLEEFMAEEFRAYAMSGGTKRMKDSPKANSIFRKILDFLKVLFRGSKTSSVIENPLSNDMIFDLYDKLYTGNLDAYNFDVNNRDQTIGSMDHALLASDPNAKIKELGFDDANLLVTSVDSIISTTINKFNTIRTESSLTAGMMRGDTIGYAYRIVKDHFRDITIPELEKQRDNAINPYEKDQFQQRIDLVQWAIDNFGDFDKLATTRRSGKSLIAYHIEKSKYLTDEDRDALTNDDIDEVKQILTAKDYLHSQSGNEKSQLELAAPEIQTLIRSIHKFDDKQKPVLNRLGIQELNDHHHMINKLARVLTDSTDMNVMYDRLRQAASTDAAIAEVVSKLGPPTTDNTTSKNLWINFWSTFNMANIKLIQMNIEEEQGDYTTTIGHASTQSSKVGNLWKNIFSTHPSSKYILTNRDTTFIDRYNSNYLDIEAIIKDFSEGTKLRKGSEFDFFRAIGINLSDKPVIRKALTPEGGNVGHAAQMFNRLKTIMNERGITQLYALNDVFREYAAANGFPAIGNEAPNFNALKDLETENSDYANNFMRTNAKGDIQFEQSLHNTISIMVANLNEVKTYADLLAIPSMSYLDISTNSFAAASIWLNSLFDLDNYEPGSPIKTGEKRKTGGINGVDVKINMSNLSGIQLIDENGDQGISSAGSDEFSKLILDFHLNTMAHKPELMRHADKSTSFSVWLSSVTGGSKDNTTYVDTIGLVKNQDGDIIGYGKAAQIVKRYVNAELLRINKLRELSKQKDLVYDANYLKEGQNFIIFEQILPEDIKKTLLKYENTAVAYEVVPGLEARVTLAIIKYFEDQTTEVKELMAKADWVDQALIDKTTIAANQAGASGKGVSKANAKDALVRSFVVNSWIHNLESMSMIYGDIAQYNMVKDEFHKRNAGAGSTGKLFASDKGTIAYVNKKGRKYAASKDIAEKVFADDGSYDTAILADNTIPSKSYDLYYDAIKESMLVRNEQVKNPKKKLTVEAIEAKARAAAKAYLKNDEGDAQGWITFDFYRAASILEGKWSDIQENMYNEIVAGKKIDHATALEFFPTRKYQYWGSLKVGKGMPPLTAMHKFSLFPLIPSVIEGTNLEQLHMKMMTEEIDYATFKSGSKISTLTRIDADGKAIQDKLYEGDGQSHTFEKTGTFTKNTVYIQFLKDQLEIAPHFKERVTFPTQMRKLIENGLMEGGVPTDFMVGHELSTRQKAWEGLSPTKKLESKRYAQVKEYEADIEALTELRKKELEQEADIKRDKDGNILMNDKLAKFLVDELKRQDLGEHEIAFLKQINGKLSKDLSLSLSAEKMEKVLNSIVVRRLVKQKFNGEGLIQVSGAGFESVLRGELTDEEKVKYGTNGLAFYGRGKDGNTTAMKVKIALQGDFLNLLYLNHKDGKPIETRERLNNMLKDEVWLNADNHRAMVSIIGPRIPVQGLNSMEFAEVYEFLPVEAGNIVVLPTEIVAKSGSDFDIDKLTFLMPNISSGVNFEYWATAPGKAKLAEIRDLNPDIADELTDEKIAEVIANRKDKDKSALDKQILKMLADNSQKNVTYLTDGSAEGLENKILNNMRNILQLKENFVDLIRPNGTDIVKEGLADKIADDVMEFDPKTVTYIDKDGKEAKRIPGNRVFEIRYNLYKHASNNIGKQTLGLGAVDNTYNSLFNRIGARMNHSYDSRGITKRLEILLQHNTLKDEQGRDVISLSHIMDANGENSIADVISQLMNGWVDIAKDAWIFNLQGNKEVAPVLLFMVQAGVPIKQAVYMAANPMVRAYVKEQKLARSTFAGPLDKSPGNWRFYRNAARGIILGQPQYGINIAPEALTNANRMAGALNDITLTTTGNAKEFFNPDTVEDNLYSRVKAYSTAQKAAQAEGKPLNEQAFYTDEDRAVFLHFIEIEEMAKSMTAIKTKTNVDTSRSNTLFEAQNRLEMIEELKQDGKFPEWMITKLIGDPDAGIKGESPIASFNIQGFQIKLWKDFFKLRNDSRVNTFILNKMRSPGFVELAEDTWGDSEKMVNQFRNGLVPFVFQNYMRNFNVDNIKDYKGVEVNTSYAVKGAPSLEHGVFVKRDEFNNRVFYVDKIKLKKDFQTLGTESSTGFAGAKLNAAAFPTSGSYYSFIFERELLRSMYPADTHWSVLKERGDVQEKLKRYNQEMIGKSKAQIETLVYEETLRDMALDNTFNMHKLFKSRESMADQLVQIQVMYPELASQYAIMSNLAPSVREIGRDRTANIMLNDIMIDADKVNIFNQNLVELSNPAKLKISTDNAQEKQRVADFFKRLSVYAFLQSGMTTTGMFSLVRVVPQDRFTGQIIPYAADFMKNINPITLQRYWNQFIRVSQDKRLRSRMRDYSVSGFNPSADAKLSVGKNPAEILKIALGEKVDADRFATDNAGNTLYYANPSLTQNGQLVTGVLKSEAESMVKQNPDKVFVMNGAIGAMNGADKNEQALIHAKETLGNVIPFPVKTEFSYTPSKAALTDVTLEEAERIQGQMKTGESVIIPVPDALKKGDFIDVFKYYGTLYDIQTVNGIATGILRSYDKDNKPHEYKGKGEAKAKLLAAYNKNKDVDPQTGKAFRGMPGYDKPQVKVTSKYELKPGMMANEDQKAAIDKIDEFLKSEDSYFLLEGGAGVGKTSSINKAIEKFRGNIVGAAISAEATSTLQLNMIGKKTMTIAKLIGLVTEKVGEEIKFRERNKFEEKKFRDAQKVDPIERAHLVIIDEASMIDTKTLEMLERLKPASTKIIYLGDRTQLPPIGEVVSKVFTQLETSKNYSKLDKPMRFGEGDPIFQITNDIFAKNINNHFKGDKIVVDPLMDVPREDMISPREAVLFRKKSLAILASIVEQFKKARANNNLKEVVVIADTNAMVASLNKSIRKDLYGENAAQFVPGEVIVFKAPLIIDNKTAVDNNTKAIVKRISERNVKGVDSYELDVTLYEIEMDGTTSESDQRILIPKDKAQFRIILSEMANQAKVTKAWPAFYSFKESFADIDYGYAMTVHKVQGSTYKTVYVDVENIYRPGNPRKGLEINQMMRTATSRPTTNLILMSNDYHRTDADGIKSDEDIISTDTEIFDQVETSEEAKYIAVEDTRKTVETSTAEKLVPINGMTVNPIVKAKIDETIKTMLDFKEAGYDIAFPGTGLGQYMIGADDLTGELSKNSSGPARATFVYLSQQLWKNFQYVNPNLEKVLQGNEDNFVQKDAPISNEEVRIALEFFDKNCG